VRARDCDLRLCTCAGLWCVVRGGVRCCCVRRAPSASFCFCAAAAVRVRGGGEEMRTKTKELLRAVSAAYSARVQSVRLHADLLNQIK
jgi:hypothetical protein